MDSILAYFLAIIGNIITSIVTRLVRLSRKRRKGILAGMILGFVTGVILIAWIAIEMELTASLGVALVYVLTTGITRLFITDSALEKWLKTRHPGSITEMQN